MRRKFGVRHGQVPVATTKTRHHPCCNGPRPEFHSSWKDETGRCANCERYLRYGNGPLLHGAWPKKVSK